MQAPKFKPNPSAEDIPPEYLEWMTVVHLHDGDALVDPDDENYLVMTSQDDETIFHLVYRDDYSAISLLRTTEKLPVFMLRDRCRFHSESLPYEDYGFWALCHPLLSPKMFDVKTKGFKTLSKLRETDYSLDLYQLYRKNYAEKENKEAAETFADLFGTIEKIVKTISEKNCINSQDVFGNTPLHLAVAKQDIKIVKFLILLGADSNIVNNEGHSAFHVAAQMISLFPLLSPKYKKENVNEEIVLCLMQAGAKYCEWDAVACSNVCMSNQKRQMLFPDEPNLMEELQFPEDNVELDHNKNAIRFIKEVINIANQSSDRPNVVSGLSLDGGGVKGLVMLQILIAIEERLDTELKDYFDWVAGTSTGAIVAGAIGRGMSLRTIQTMYFKFKDAVFQRKIFYIPYLQPAYSATVLENYLKEELGEKTTLADIEYPKMFFTTVRSPKKLLLQRTYWKPWGKYSVDDDPQSTCLWRALRRSTAAPTYFRECAESGNVYVDGGLLSNNPAAYVLKEISDWNHAVPVQRKVLPGCILSVGCGIVPEKPPSILNSLVGSATATDGHVVEKDQTNCRDQHIPFFRLSPHLSQDVDLATTENDQILSFMWETYLYTKTHRHVLDEIADLLKLIGTNEQRRMILT